MRRQKSEDSSQETEFRIQEDKNYFWFLTPDF